MNFLKVLDPAENILSRIKVVIDLIEELKDEYRQLTDSELKDKTQYFLKRIESGETIDDLIHEAMATVREAAYRIHKLFAFRSQLIGSLIIYEGNFAEMKTGEGKTLTISLAAYVLALEKKGVHVVTVNEYLVKRDAEFCRKILNFLGMTVGFNTSRLVKYLKKDMFKCDVTYTTNSELAFDYLRDNMSYHPEEVVIPDLNVAIIDEGDSVLIDEASTPLIISMPFRQKMSHYIDIDIEVKKLKAYDYSIDWETKTVILLTTGILKLEHALNLKKLYSFENSEIINKIHNSLIANFTFQLGKEYIVQENKIMLVDQWTGRILKDRSYSNGLQQALQAKEYLKIENESRTAAKITYQSFFRQYKKLSALSGTAYSEAKEFAETYNMIVVKVPTNKKIQRLDLPDVIFKNRPAKIKAIIQEIKKHYITGQPILVGTSSVEESEVLYEILKKENIPCEILNARNHDREAEIISRAGIKHSVTIATNIAGRGVDIKITPEVEKLGGLYVLGCEKNESKRVDDQLRGRSGRQGDPGKSIFFVSLEDNIFKRFGADKLDKSQKKIKDDSFDSIFLSRTLASMQQKIQYANFDARKNLIEYNEVLSLQQEIIYKQRMTLLKNNNNFELFLNIIDKNTKYLIKKYIDDAKEENKGPIELSNYLNQQYFDFDLFSENDFLNRNIQWNHTFIKKIFLKAFEVKKEKLVDIDLEDILREVSIRNIDEQWQEHLDLVEKIKNTINLRSMEQKSPLNIFVEKLDELFQDLLRKIRENTLKEILNLPNSFVQEECLHYLKEIQKS